MFIDHFAKEYNYDKTSLYTQPRHFFRIIKKYNLRSSQKVGYWDTKMGITRKILVLWFNQAHIWISLELSVRLI